MRARLLTFLFWGGIALAPLAALLLIVVGSSTTGLRFAAIIAIIAVVAVGLSITMRRDAASTKLDLEETLLDEIDMLRDDVRADITTAARATHKALAEKVQSLQETIEYMRRQVEAARAAAEVERPAIRPSVPTPPRRVAGPPATPPGVVRHTETVQVTTRQTIVDPVDDERGAYSPGVYGTRPAPARPASARPAAGDRDEYERARPARDGWDDRGRGPGDRSHEDQPREVRRDERPARDTSREDDLRAAWTITAAREESWTEQKLREYAAGRTTDPYPDSGDIREPVRSRATDRDDPGDEDRWSAMRAGDRWAEVRSDDRGRELRMGERRAAVRSDETGTQLRIVDRWSSVRQENPSPSSYAQEDEHTGETRRERRRREEASGGDRRDSGPDDVPLRSTSRPALPAADESRALESRAHGDRAWDLGSRADRFRDDPSHAPVKDGRSWEERFSGELPRAGRADDPYGRDERSRDDRRSEGRAPSGRVAEARTPQGDPPREARPPRTSVEDSWPPRRDEPREPRRDDPRDQPRRDEARRDEPRRDETRRDQPRRDEARRVEPRRDDGRPDARDIPQQRVPRSQRPAVPPTNRGERDDDRWERESSGPRSTTRPRRLDFEATDDRWH